MIPDHLQTGNAVIDSEHANILAEMELLRHAVFEPPEFAPRISAVLEFIEFFRGHAAAHFANEEMLASEMGYPDLAKHRDEHLRFFDKFINLRARIQRDGAAGPVDEFVDEVEAWVTRHVLEEDVKLAEWIRTREATAAA